MIHLFFYSLVQCTLWYLSFFYSPCTLLHYDTSLFFTPQYSVHYDTSLFFTPLYSLHYDTSHFLLPCPVYIMIPLFFLLPMYSVHYDTSLFYSPCNCTLWYLYFFTPPVQCTLWYLSFFTPLYSVHYDTSLWSSLFKDAQRRPARELVNPDQASSTFSTVGRNLGNQSINQLIILSSHQEKINHKSSRPSFLSHSLLLA